MADATRFEQAIDGHGPLQAAVRQPQPQQTHRNSMTRLRFEREFSLSPPRLWPWIAEAERARQWLPGVEELRYEQADEQLGVGSALQLRLTQAGQSLELRGTLTAFEAGRRLALQATSHSGPKLSLELCLELTPLPQGARLCIETQLVFESWMLRALASSFAQRARGELELGCTRLESLCAAQP